MGDRRDDGDPTNHRVIHDAAPRLQRRTDDGRKTDAGVVGVRLRARERDAVVAQVNDERLVVLARSFQLLDDQTDALIQPRDRLIVLGKFAANLGAIGQEGRDDDIAGRIADALDPLVVGLIGEFARAAAAVGVALPHH